VIIDWSIVQRALLHYSRLGYIEHEVPWMVRAPAYDATRPEGSLAAETLNYGDRRFLVASGEQSFLDMLGEPGRFVPNVGLMCVTPCFRIEPVPDELHLPYFLKLELMVPVTTEQLGRRYLHSVVAGAQGFFRGFVSARRVDMPDGSVDIETEGGIELGSYGVRTWRDFTWVYGTGVALPRLQQAVKAEREAGR
jgi:hypothetical protein